jgi:site-specific DNA recombinase
VPVCLEQIVVNRIRRLLSEPVSLFEMVKVHAGEPLLQQSLMARAAELAAEAARMSPLRMRVILVALVQRIEVGPDQVIIHLRPRRLPALLDDRLAAANPDPLADEPSLPLTHPVQLRRAGKEVRMVIDHTDPFAPLVKPDPSLLKVIAKAHRFNEKLLRGGAAKFADLAKSEKLHRSYYSQILRLAYLALGAGPRK